MTPNGDLTVLHTFGPTDADGTEPNGLLQATDGAIYGTTATGGSPDCGGGKGCGTIFKLDVGLKPFVAFVLGAGKVGTKAQILGQGLIGTTSVSFNGIPADFTVVSDTFIKATVPQAAGTGYVTVTTPGRTLTSNKPFHVIP